MSAPGDRKYLQTHEWHKLEGNIVTIGITQFAADELTDITYVSLPKVGTKVSAGKPFGEIESVKATADLISGVSGTVIEVNSALVQNPGLVNQDPYVGGWMVKVQIASPAEMDKLMPLDDYLKAVGQ